MSPFPLPGVVLKTKCRIDRKTGRENSSERNTYGHGNGRILTSLPGSVALVSPAPSPPPLALPGWLSRRAFFLFDHDDDGRFSPYIGLTFLICEMGMCETSLSFLQPFSFSSQRPGREFCIHPPPHFLQEKQVEGKQCTSRGLDGNKRCHRFSCHGPAGIPQSFSPPAPIS